MIDLQNGIRLPERELAVPTVSIHAPMIYWLPYVPPITLTGLAILFVYYTSLSIWFFTLPCH